MDLPSPTEDALRESEERYRSLFNSIDEGFCVVEMHFDGDGRPLDYRFLEANRVFEQQTGLRDAVGRTARELVPDLEAQWFERYGRVARSGEPERFIDGSEAMGRWFDVYAFRVGGPASRKVAILFTDITARKRIEDNLAILADVSRGLAADVEPRAMLRAAVAKIGTFFRADACALAEAGADGRPSLTEVWHAETVGAAPSSLADLTGPGAGAVLTVPLSTGRSWRVMLVLTRGGGRDWRHDESELAHELAVRVATRLDVLRHDQALRESEERFRNMADNAPVMVWQTEPDGTCTYLSQSWYDFTGQTPETGLGFGWLDAAHPDDRQPAADIFLAANARREAFRLEYRLRRRDGTYAWAIDSAAPRIGRNGEFLGYIGSVIDISDRKRVEAALRESEQRARLALAIARLGTWSWDVERDGVTCDARCRELGFLDPAAALALADIVPRVHPEDWPRVQAALQRALDPAGEGTYEAEFRFVHPDGRLHWVVSRGQTTFAAGPAGRKPVHVLGSILDITERKAHEAELRAANHMKDEFLATLSHELRTPLNAVVGWAHILRMGHVKPEIREKALESLERNAKVQAQLVDDLLDVSRIISGKLQIAAEPVELAGVVAGAIETVGPAAQAKGVALQMTTFPDQELLVTGDAGRLRQVVWNLLSNAVKFTQDGGRIDVGLRRAGADAEIVVRDTGQGIPADFLPFVFERFRQADGSTTRRHGGLGLGLAIVRHLTEAHGGSVSAASEGAGRGAAFTVRLPLRDAAGLPDAGAAGGQDLVGSAALAGVRALVVDDQPDTRELLCAVLASARAHVASAGSAADALALAGREPFDVLLADIAMPGEDGYALVERLRRSPHEHLRRLPAVAVTAYASPADRERALAAGFQSHLPKPIDPNALVAAVGAVLAPVRPRLAD